MKIIKNILLHSIMWAVSFFGFVALVTLAIDALEYEATGQCIDCILLQYLPHID